MTLFESSVEPGPSANSIFPLLRLNDDCLIAIGRQLTLVDLNALASTCRRLNDVAREVFVLRKENKELIMEKIAVVDVDYKTDLNQQETDEYLKAKCEPSLQHFNQRMKRHLRNFGDLIETLHFGTYARSRNRCYLMSNYVLFEDVLRYCSGGNLKKIELVKFRWTPEIAERAQPLFSCTQSISFLDCVNVRKIFPKCAGATSLEMRCRTYDCNEALWGNFFPELVKIQLDTFPITSLEKLGAFLTRHTHLKEVECHCLRNFDLGLLFHLRRLEKVDFSFYDEPKFSDTGLSALGPISSQFMHLQSLKVDCIWAPIGEVQWAFLRKLSESGAVNSLEKLFISSQTCKETPFNELHRFKKLKEFESKFSSSDEILWKNSLNIHKLEKLSITKYKIEAPLIRLAPIQSSSFLKTLRIEIDIIDDDFIRRLSFFPALRELRLKSNEFHASDVALAELWHVTNLTEFELGAQLHTAVSLMKWLENLGSTRTLQKLKLSWDCFFYNEFIVALSRFTELRTLKIEATFGAIGQQRESLQQLNKLEVLAMKWIDNENYSTALDFISSLGSPESLTQFEFHSYEKVSVSNELFENILPRFKNLRILKFLQEYGDVPIEIAVSSPKLQERNRKRMTEFEPAVAHIFPLLSLNNECLIAVGRQLSLADLNARASTCQRLNAVSRDAFVLQKENKALLIKRVQTSVMVTLTMKRQKTN